jgi:hypothetical protein
MECTITNDLNTEVLNKLEIKQYREYMNNETV